MRRGREIVASRAEEDVYKALGLPYIEPELREGRDEIALAKAGRLSRLVRSADVNGILHAHTDASDGLNTLEEMAKRRAAAVTSTSALQITQSRRITPAV